MTQPKECAKCGAIFPAAAARQIQMPGHEAKCTVCGAGLKALVDGERGKPWSKTDSALWFLGFPGAHVIIPIIVVLCLIGIMTLGK